MLALQRPASGMEPWYFTKLPIPKRAIKPAKQMTRAMTAGRFDRTRQLIEVTGLSELGSSVWMDIDLSEG